MFDIMTKKAVTRLLYCLIFLVTSLFYFGSFRQNGKTPVLSDKWMRSISWTEKFLVFLGKSSTEINKAHCKSVLNEGRKGFSSSTIYFGANAEIAKRYNEDRQMLEKYKCSEGLMRRFPQIIIIGAAKCGTGALDSFLEYHPNLSGATKSEMHFLRGDEFNSNMKRHPNYEVYLPMIKCSTMNQRTFLKEVYYKESGIPAKIFHFDPCIKLILTVKEPVHRVISNFLHYRAKNTSADFMDKVFTTNNTLRNIHWISTSMYNIHLKNWLRYFPKQQIHVVDGNSLVTDPFVEMVKLERFLNIPSFYKKENFVYSKEKGYFCFVPDGETSSECLKANKGRTKPQESLEEMLGHYVSKDVNTSEVIHKLKTFFKPHMKEFYELTQRTFSWKD